MKFEEFKKLIICYKAAITGESSFSVDIARFWYNKYFKYYDAEELDKVFDYLIKSANQYTKFRIADIFNGIIEFYGFLLHEEVDRCREIIKEAKKNKIYFDTATLPKISFNYSVPNKRAWLIALKEEKC